jgi:hypothetical protein
VSLTLKRDEFIDFTLVIQKALEEHGNLGSHGKVAFRLGEHSSLFLSMDELCDFSLCLVTAQQKIYEPEKQFGVAKLFETVGLN